jgi:hypothetical protein
VAEEGFVALTCGTPWYSGGGSGVDHRRAGNPVGMDVDAVEDLRQFVLDRLAEDEQRAAREELPQLDEAELRGRLRILRTDEGGLMLVPGPTEAQDGQAPVPFEEKAALLRDELAAGADDSTLRLLATAYETHHGWQEEWRT